MDFRVKDWRSLKLPINDNLKHLLSTGFFSDVQITVKYEGRVKTFSGHRLLLMMISPVFEAMLSGYFIEKNEILIEDVEHDVFQTLFDYLYLQTLVLPDLSHAWKVYQLASKYIVDPVSEYCIKYIKENCSMKNCCINYNYAEFFGFEDIKKKSYELMICDLPSLFLQPEYLTLSKTAIASILGEPVLSVNESHLFKNLEKWINSQISLKEGKKERKRLGKLLTEELVKKIHFLEMTPTEFADSVGSSQFLTQSEKLSIFMYISGSKKEHPLESSIQYFEKKRLKDLNCQCQGNNESCEIYNFDLHSVHFTKSSFLELYNVHLGASATRMSFCFRLSSPCDTVLFTGQSDYQFKIHVSNQKLTVAYNNKSINFENIVTDGLRHIILVSFVNNSCYAKLDRMAAPNNSSFSYSSQRYFSSSIFGSSSNNSEVDFCLSSFIFTNTSEDVDLKDYHSRTEGISLCYCVS